MEQRSLQGFSFLGKLFIDLRLVFGDKMACLCFDRFHYCIIEYFVRPVAPIPQSWTGRTIDDVPVVAPPNALAVLEKFTKTYKDQLSRLGIEYAPVDSEKRKAFDMETEGEVLGIVFNTTEMSWRLPGGKVALLIRDIVQMIKPGVLLSLNEVEIVHGKLCYFSQHCSPIKLF